MFWAARALHWCIHRVVFLFLKRSIPRPRGLGNLLKVHRAGDRLLQLLIFNEEFLVNASHQLALITSLPFVHTARRYYRLNVLVRLLDGGSVFSFGDVRPPEGSQTWTFRGSKSRNKVSVGEPAEGSLEVKSLLWFLCIVLEAWPRDVSFFL